MSTITKIVDRPIDAPKEPVYPRLLQWHDDPGLIIWATGPGRSIDDFAGITIISSNCPHSYPVGEYCENHSKKYYVDFPGAVTLYNK